MLGEAKLMLRLKMVQAAVFMLAANIMVLASLHYQSPVTIQPTGRLIGTVADINKARVARAAVVVEGEGATRTAMTSEDGTYQIELPTGVYRIKVESIGFCPARRAAFRVQQSTTARFNFTLVPCPISNDLRIVNGQYRGEVDHYRDPFKEEIFPLAHSTGAPLELLVRYGERREDKNTIEYRGTVINYDEYADSPAGSIRRNKYLGVTVSYDSLMIHADRVRLDPQAFRLEAEGNVIVEDGNRCVQVNRAVADLKTGDPNLHLTQ